MRRIPDQFDAIVVGAGVAGGTMAALLAARGMKTLLVEKSAWPREIVCGGCLNAAAVHALHRAGLGSVIRTAEMTRKIIWRSGDRSFEHPIPPGVAVLRRDLDAAIVDRAIEHGCTFLPRTSASLEPADSTAPWRVVKLKTESDSFEVRAKYVIAADGIGGTFLRNESWATWSVAANSFMGAAFTSESRDPLIPAHTVHMSIGDGGYVGMVRIDETTVHIGAALDPRVCRELGGPRNLIGRILRSCGRDLPEGIEDSHVQGKGRLTRHRRQLGGHRVLALGDACGYVEPVTGEGIAWGLQGALALNGLLPDPDAAWPDDLAQRWGEVHRHLLGPQQRICRAMRWLAHHPAVARRVFSLASRFPQLAGRIVSTICPDPDLRQEHFRDASRRFDISDATSKDHARPAGDWHSPSARGDAGEFAPSRAHAGGV